MKLRFLQLIVFIAGCLGLFFICYPECLSMFKENECEKLHFRIAEYPEQTNFPIQADTSQTISMRDTVLSAI